ncbi:UNVERIFIED_ORG: hypothetical protein J2Y81_007802 [Paraburkholderia sediminicola]|nr:hypothetical protein [Paraburkholderia sediminicola]
MPLGKAVGKVDGLRQRESQIKTSGHEPANDGYPLQSIRDTGALSNDMEALMKQWVGAMNSRPELLSTDLFWIAVVKRTVSLASAIDAMIESKNMVAA